MITKPASMKRPDILGNGDCSSHRGVFNAMGKQWWRRLSYLSILATVPALLVSHVEGARSDDTEKPAASDAGQGAGRLQKPKVSGSNPQLLKRQSEFRLPHQIGSFDVASAPAGKDDCPGQTIPGGNYTAAAPFTVSGDTTGANNTVTHLQYYYYYSFDSAGPDHIYSFTLTGLGPNPKIEVSTSSGTYKPLVYVLYGENDRGCPAGTGNSAYAAVASGADSVGTATLDAYQMNVLPLNVPLHLFVDSIRNDATGSGPYTIRMQDVTIAGATACSNHNPIDCTDFFVRQQYLDFLGREPDSAGYTGWQNILNNCGTSVAAPCDRIEVSSDFFRSPEFQDRGYFTYRFYSTLGRNPNFNEFMPDLAKVSGFLSDTQLEANKSAFVQEFMTRPEFKSRYDSLTNPVAYVDGLLQATELQTHPSRDKWIAGLTTGSLSRAQVLRQLVESAEVYHKFYNKAFVVEMYFGYLRRDPDILYLNWIQTMDQNGGDYRAMINGFVNSIEYRKRFEP
ncbi:MAG: hypothetical protein DMF68_15690 [Acidobacteria bacterium]|nr:MAG: hypothetical protein DMF68_15690 [Acidobacteriota bacterium]